MNRLVSSIVVVVGLVASSRADAKVTKLAVADISIDVPKKWTVTAGDGQLTLAPKDQSLAISLTHVASNDLDGAWSSASAKASELLGTPLGDRMDGSFGNLTGYVATGSGSLGGVSVEALVSVLATPRHNVLAVVVFGQIGKYEKHEKEMTKALTSLKGGAPAIEDAGYDQLSSEAQAIADKVVGILEKNDTKAYLAMVDGDPRFEVFIGDDQGGGEGFTKKQLAKALKKQKKITKLLAFPTSGAWRVTPGDTATSFYLWRADGAEYVTRLQVRSYDGAWHLGDSVTVIPGPPDDGT